MNKKTLLILILSVSMAIIMCVVWFTIGAVAASRIPIYGDANGDRTVDMGDITKVCRIILGQDEPTLGADANRNGIIDMADAIKIERQFFGMDVVHGDANGDLTVDNLDIQEATDMYLGLKECYKGADANCDGKVNMLDVTAIQLMLLD